MKAEEQLKQSMQDMHLSTEAKNRILANVLTKTAGETQRKRPFYCSPVFLRIAGACSAIAVVLAVVLAVSLSGGARMKDAAAPRESVASEQAASAPEQDMVYAFPVLDFSDAVILEPGDKSQENYSYDGEKDDKVNAAPQTIPNGAVITGWASNTPEKKRDTLTPGSENANLYSVFKYLQSKDVFDSKDIALYGIIRDNFSSGTVYVISEEERDGRHVWVILVTEEKTVSSRYVPRNDVPTEGQRYIIVAKEDPETEEITVETVEKISR